MSEETVEIQVEVKSDIQNALEELKCALLLVLYDSEVSLTLTEILHECDIPRVKDNEDSEVTVIRGILACLCADGHAKYNTKSAGWQITEKGVSLVIAC